MTHRLFEEIQELIVVHGADRGERLEGKAIAKERGERQHVPAGVTDAVGTGEGRRGHLLGKFEIDRGGRGHEVSTLLLQGVLTNQMVKHFLNEQRIALRRVRHRRDELVGWSSESEPTQELADLAFAEAGQRERTTDLFALDARGQMGEPLIGVDRPMRPDDQHRHRLAGRHIRHRERQVLEEVQRERIGPVDVVDDDE